MINKASHPKYQVYFTIANHQALAIVNTLKTCLVWKTCCSAMSSKISTYVYMYVKLMRGGPSDLSVQHNHQGLVTFLIVILYVSFINLMCQNSI